MKKIYPLLGIIGPLIYIMAVFIGGALRGDYNPFYNSISELLIPGSPNLLLLSILFAIYNVSLILFIYGIFQDPELAKSKTLKAAVVMIALIGILGLLFIFFPQDPRGAPTTLAGMCFEYLAARAMTAMEITMKRMVYRSGFMKIMLSAKAVDRSVTKVAAKIIFTRSEFDISVSISTEYTTAREVVESAIPPIKAASKFHPATKYV